jgi:hypothetical protein
MTGKLISWVKRVVPESSFWIPLVGHRLWVGGKWEEIGRLQFDFMVRQGLRPEHYLLDVGCGALRGGALFIPYLDAGHYMGIDKEAVLLERGKREIRYSTLISKDPQLLVTERFDFSEVRHPPDFALAVSLFTHLTPQMIQMCMRNLRIVADTRTAFFASFFRVESKSRNPRQSHSHKNFFYTIDELERIAADAGWSAEYIGDWSHPRGQDMICFRVAAEDSGTQ